LDPVKRSGEREQEDFELPYRVYRSAGDVVDPVFFPVVPDSFMNRDPAHHRVDRGPLPASDDRIIAERAALGPRDRWSF
jgi:hypothetical protein